jgi:hypothetical protein
MKNVIKGWITSLFGLAVMITDALYFFGIISLPNPSNVPQPLQIGIAFLAGLGLFLLPSTWIEEKLKGYISKKAE